MMLVMQMMQIAYSMVMANMVAMVMIAIYMMMIIRCDN
jgi:hypothetical protein